MKVKGNQAARRAGNKKAQTMRRIAVVTGTRAEYGLLRSTLTALQTHANVNMQLVVTGSHLLRRFGYSVDEILTDGWQIDARVPMQRGDDGPLDQAEGLARGVAGIARFLQERGTDIVVVLGDRIEAMAAALAAVTTGKILAHIHGGDLAAGDFDDALRHAITKLAHLHFPATRQSARRIIRMGESRERVFMVGAPGLDRIVELLEARRNSRRANGLRSTSHVQNGHKHALVVQHPCGRSREKERAGMNTLLDAVLAEDFHVSCLYPNTDRGHLGIIDAIDAHARSARNGEFRATPTLPRDEYLLALHDADVLVGNSSSGIIEAASVGTPAVNVGLRQFGRQAAGPGVINCAESAAAIRRALQTAARRRKAIPGSSIYGDGNAGKRIAKTLAQVSLHVIGQRKHNTY